MRLICPNCDAEYEVDGSQISAEGRDVQCSNCAHTWLVMPEGFDDTADLQEAEPGTAPGFEPETAPSELPEKSYDEELIAKAFAAPAGAAVTPKRNSVDPEALNVIHEEVALETRARQEELGGVETQTELGLDQGLPGPAETGDLAPEPDLHSADHTPGHGTDDVQSADALGSGLEPAQKPSEGTKRELLPDIEEINSTLIETPDPVYDEDGNIATDTAPQSSRRGFRLGFGLMLLLTALLLLFYAYAPAIAARFPQFEGQITSLVAMLDGLRLALDRAAQGLLEKLDTLTDQFGK